MGPEPLTPHAPFARGRAGWVGPAAAVVAVVAQWVLHVAVPRAPFAPFSLGEWAVRRAPGGLATAAIDQLGHQALRILAAATVAGAVAVGWILRRARPPWLGLAALAGTLVASVLDPRRPDLLHALGAGLVAAAGAALTATLLPAPRLVTGRPSPDGPTPDWDRRRLVLGGLGLLGAVVLGGAALVRPGRRAAPDRVPADRPSRPNPDPPLSSVVGLSPAVTARARHYVVDIDLDDPVVDGDAWRLQLRGAVAEPTRWSLEALRAMPTVERLITLTCISNTIGGPLIGTARWIGVPLPDLLRLARPGAQARFLVAHAADGYTESFPLAEARRPDALVAFGMNGSLLPRAHGYPARLLIPGHYGMKQVKWLDRLELVDVDPVGYWGQRGWDPTAVIRTGSRFDVPHAGDDVAGRFTTAGVAWAGDRRIAAVEVSTDDGRSWKAAVIEREQDPLAWRRWTLDLDLPPGVHPLTVRAVDGTGRLQDPDRRAPHPSGASGYHRIVVTVAR
jgi:sulfite oxidase